MRILHVDSGRAWRGGQAQVMHLLDALPARRHESWLAAPAAAPLALRARETGVPIVDVAARGDLDLGSVMQLTRAMKRIRPDLVHAHTARAHALGVMAADLAGVAHRVVTRRVDLPVSGGLFGAWKYRRGVTRYIAISQAVAARLTASGIEPGKVRVVYSGVSPEGIVPVGDPMARERARKALALPSGAKVAALVGALTREKGHDVALRAVANVPGLLLVSLGEGVERENLERLAASLGLADRVLFAGFRSDLRELWPAFDLVMAPSRHEGLGTGVIEAMSAGQAIVASAVGELPILLDGGGAGVLVPAEDPAALAREVAELLMNDARRASLGQAARERSTRYSVSGMVSGTVKVYEELAN